MIEVKGDGIGFAICRHSLIQNSFIQIKVNDRMIEGKVESIGLEICKHSLIQNSLIQN